MTDTQKGPTVTVTREQLAAAIASAEWSWNGFGMSFELGTPDENEMLLDQLWDALNATEVK